jgi:thiamine biosynthesis lipoprotein
MAKKMLLKILVPILLAFLLALFFRQVFNQSNKQPVTVDSGRMFIMGTLARIQIEADTSEQGSLALKKATEALHDFDQRISTYREDSEMSKVNRLAGDGPVKVSDMTFYILQKSIYYSKISNGAFDITVTPLLKLWKKAAKENRLPTPAEVAEAEKYVGWEKIILTENPKAVRFPVKGVKLTVNAIAKGYAVDCALEALKIPGVSSGLVDIGGEVSCFGKSWIVGIQDPFAQDNENQLSQAPRWRLRCQNVSIATSGNYRRYVSINGKHYSHIVDPRTGQPAEKIPSVTIIAPKTIDADALATALSVMNAEEGIQLAEKLPDVEAFLVAGTPEKPQYYRTSGFKKYEIPSD